MRVGLGIGVGVSSKAPASNVGANVLINSSFATDLAGWIPNGWIWVAGDAEFVAGGTDLQQNGVLELATNYLVTAKIAAVSDGSFRFRVGSNSSTLFVATPDLTVSVIVNSGLAQTFIVRQNAAFPRIEWVTCQKVLS
jgi:hypothetical protein